MLNKLRVFSAFSGIGAFEKALEELGIDYELVHFSEIDKYAIKSYCAIHGADESLNVGDISKVDERNIKDFDLFTYGFPCQDISVAGLQRGLTDGQGLTRSGMLYHALRIIQHKMPKYAIAENVKNLVGKKFKKDFESYLAELEFYGYNNYWKVLNAKDFGIAQNRERVFVVSIRKDVDNEQFEFPKGFDNGLRLKDFLEDEVNEKYYVPQEKVEKLISNLKNERIMNKLPKGDELKIIGSTQNSDAMGTNFRSWVYDIEGKVGTLSATMYKEPTQVCIPCITPDRLEKRQNGRRVYDADGISPTLNTMQGGNRQPKVAVKEATKKGYSEATVGDSINILYPTSETRRGRVGKEIAQTLDTSCSQATLTHDYRIRKLTPKECFRLMGFSDFDFEKAKNNGISDSQLYKQAGNSIVTTVPKAIFENLFKDYIKRS